MKKAVLMLLAVGTWAYVGAQSASLKPVLMKQSRTREHSRNDAPSFFVQSTSDKVNDRKKAGLHPQAAGAVPCGSAFNLYGVLDACNTNVTVDSTLGLILFTHREDDSKVATGGSGAYEASISTNMGASFDTSLIMFSGVTTRYPNGVIYNPTGNKTLNNAYWVTNGPVAGSSTTDAYIGWDSAAFGSMTFGGSNLSQQYKRNGKSGVIIEDEGNVSYMSIGTDDAVHSIGDGYLFSSTSDKYTGASVNTGIFNSGSNNFTWTQNLIYPHFMPSDHVSTVYDTVPEILTNSGSAWSQDGKVGYAVFFGNLDSTDFVSGANLDFVTNQPIVYKTINSGTTWNMMTPHNWKNDSVLVNYLHPAVDSPNVAIPIWGLFHNAGAQGGIDDYDMVVDKNNNLHIISGITASSMANPDSSEYYGFFNPRRDFIFDMYTTTSTADGGWRARFIDTLAALPIQTANTAGEWVSTTSGPLAMGHRIQTSRTTDGSKIFVTWLDDYIDYVTPTPAGPVDSMQFPDMFGQGYDITTGVATPIKSFTYGTTLPQATGEFYINVSDKPLVSGVVGSRTYHIPVVRVAAPSTANDGTFPVDFLYDSTDVYTDADFIPQGIQNLKSTTFTITPNYPNPFNGITRFGVNLTKESLVNVDVFNMVGQKMVTMSPEKLSPDTHTIAINGSGFASGVYFYRVTVDGTSLTQKMIVE